MSIDQVLADKLVSWPLTRAMCAPMSDGAAAVVLCSTKGLQRFDRSRAVRIRATQGEPLMTKEIKSSRLDLLP